jgi:hypothetical protein
LQWATPGGDRAHSQDLGSPDSGTECNGLRGFADLANGKKVTVLATMQEGYLQATRINIAGPPAGNGPPGGGG